MPDSRRVAVAPPPQHSGLAYNDVTAAAQLMSAVRVDNPRWVGGLDAWQREAWDFFFNLGEFNYGVEWFGEAMSRVRLLAAEVLPGGDEPRILTSGPAVDLVENLAGGFDNQSSILRSFGVQLSIPGDCYMVGRRVGRFDEESGVLLDATVDVNGNVWTVQPSNTIRKSSRTLGDRLASVRRRSGAGRPPRGWDVQVDDSAWYPLPAESLVTRVWDRNEYLPWKANSPARAALPIMREIDMYNRHIIASLISRVALNGIWLIPDEVTLPVNPRYANQPHPFFAELFDIMRAAIKDPGSPAAALPMPLQVKSELIDKFRHLTFATPLDEKIWTSRDGAIRRLATTLNLPMEVMTGMGSTNHWNAWQLEESAIKIHISPKVEIATRCLTVGYLHPMLRAAGQSTTTSTGGRLIVWYDTSELTQRPDRSQLAVTLGAAGVINDEAVRRETGFGGDDKPTDQELDFQLLRGLVVQGGQLAGPALEKLTGTHIEAPAPAGPPQAPAADASPPNSGPGGGVGVNKASAAGTKRSMPGTRGEPPPPPDEGVTAAAVGRVAAAVARVHGTNGRVPEKILARLARGD